MNGMDPVWEQTEQFRNAHFTGKLAWLPVDVFIVAELNLRLDIIPFDGLYNAKSDGANNNEHVTINNPASGTWYVMLNGYATYSDVMLATVHEEAGGRGQKELLRYPGIAREEFHARRGHRLRCRQRERGRRRSRGGIFCVRPAQGVDTYAHCGSGNSDKVDKIACLPVTCPCSQRWPKDARIELFCAIHPATKSSARRAAFQAFRRLAARRTAVLV